MADGIAVPLDRQRTVDALDEVQRIVFSAMCFQESRNPYRGDSSSAPLIVGLDTNILKLLRRNSTTTSSLREHAEASRINLVLPVQSITEYWNNFETFTKEELSSSISAVKKLLMVTEVEGVSTLAQEILEKLNSAQSSVDVSSQAALTRSRMVINTLQEFALVGRVDRSLFSSLASSRFASKIPPGFQDSAKGSPMGDFYVWAEFLAGAAAWQRIQDWEAVRLVFVTEDSKPDWKAGGDVHPSLVDEAVRVTGNPVEFWSFRNLVEFSEQAYNS